MRTANPIERAIQQEIKRRPARSASSPTAMPCSASPPLSSVEIDEDSATSNRIYINWHSPDA